MKTVVNMYTTVVITNWVIGKKYPFLRWQWMFSLFCRFFLFYRRQGSCHTWLYS